MKLFDYAGLLSVFRNMLSAVYSAEPSLFGFIVCNEAWLSWCQGRDQIRRAHQIVLV